GLAVVDSLAEVGHQVAEGAGLPSFVESFEAFRDAVGGRRDLVRVDRVAFLARHGGIPKDERLAPREARRFSCGRNVGGPRAGGGGFRDARPEGGGGGAGGRHTAPTL